MPTTDTDTQLDPEVAALLAECKKVSPTEIIPDAGFEPTNDDRF